MLFRRPLKSRNTIKITSYLILPFVLPASPCISVQTYIPPQYRKYQDSDLQTSAQLHPVRLETEFFRNGKPLPAGSAELFKITNAVLQHTKIAVVQDQAGNTLKISRNNIAGIGQAVGRRLKPGLRRASRAAPCRTTTHSPAAVRIKTKCCFLKPTPIPLFPISATKLRRRVLPIGAISLPHSTPWCTTS